MGILVTRDGEKIDIDKLVDETIDDPKADGWHRIAGNAFKTATCVSVDQRTQDIYRHIEAESILRAVFATHPQLTAREMLLVGARLLERQEEVELLDKADQRYVSHTNLGDEPAHVPGLNAQLAPANSNDTEETS